MGESKTDITIKLLSPSHPSLSLSHSASTALSQTPRQSQQQQYAAAPSSPPSTTAGSDAPSAQSPTPLPVRTRTTMGDQQYITHGLQHSDGLSGTPSLPESTRSSGAQPASAYTVLTPYSAVSSFNYPAQCDSTLLTPISSAGSPPLHQGQKLGHQYPPPSTPNQEHTPPDNSKMYNSWNHQFDAQGQTSQHSSPMIPAAPVAPEFMHNYMPEDRRTPGPPEPYLGSYGVSNGPESHSIDHPYYVQMPPMEQPNGLIMRDAPPLEGPQGRPLAATPLLNQPHPPNYRQPRRTSMEDSMFHHHQPDVSRSMSGSPRRKPTQGNTRVKKRASRRQSAVSKHQTPPLDPADDHKNCYGQEAPPKMKASCTSIDRMVVDLRWKYRHKRGQDMWEAIQKDVQASSDGKTYGREDLQMKFRRSRQHIEWEIKDEELLQEAWVTAEAERYQNIHKKFLELGGSRNMCLNSVDIEAKITGLKLEEDVYILGPRNYPVRRRRKVPSRKRNHAPTQDDTEMLLIDSRLNNNPHHNLSQEAIVEQIYKYRGSQWADTDDSDMMDLNMANGRTAIKMEPGQEHIMH